MKIAVTYWLLVLVLITVSVHLDSLIHGIGWTLLIWAAIFTTDFTRVAAGLAIGLSLLALALIAATGE